MIEFDVSADKSLTESENEGFKLTQLPESRRCHEISGDEISGDGLTYNVTTITIFFSRHEIFDDEISDDGRVYHGHNHIFQRLLKNTVVTVTKIKCSFV